MSAEILDDIIQECKTAMTKNINYNYWFGRLSLAQEMLRNVNQENSNTNIGRTKGTENLL